MKLCLSPFFPLLLISEQRAVVKQDESYCSEDECSIPFGAKPEVSQNKNHNCSGSGNKRGELVLYCCCCCCTIEVSQMLRYCASQSDDGGGGGSGDGAGNGTIADLLSCIGIKIRQSYPPPLCG